MVLFGVISSFLNLTGPRDPSIRFERSGVVGLVFSDFLIQYFGRTGSYIILFTLGAMALIITGEFLVSPFFLKIAQAARGLLRGWPLAKKEALLKTAVAGLKPKINSGRPSIGKLLDSLKNQEQAAKEKEREKQLPSPAAEAKLEPKPVKPKIKIAAPTAQEEKAEDEEEKFVGEYNLPSLDLLDEPPAISTSKMQSDLMTGARLLEETLASFEVIARVADIERGPAITRYELEPGPGVKVQKITTLSDDIALAMRAASIRIVAPIPGKNRVGIEVPNAASASVFLKEVLATNEFRSSASKLTLALGKDIAGNPIVADLSEMPHLMIAGTTGSGKTVCVNGLIMSMLFNASPDEVKFLMVDPKMVELSQYNDIPHLLCPTVTDTRKASGALNWVVGEMESRYTRLSKAGVKNIKGFNEQGNKMPYIVVIIDELADLMQVSAKTVESSITRLAQLSRAVGIHLILATQRPSVDVITGVIKANFPARISFKVASKVDSRTVLDMNGAESLLGKGDMLFMKPGDAKPTRGQCSFLGDKEISRVMEFIRTQQKPIYDDMILKHQASGGAGGSDQKDELYDEAMRLVVETNQASVSILQRRMRLGYTRAARLIDMMEMNGIVGPYVGSKPRDILIDREQWLLEHMKEKSQQGGETNG